MVTSLAMTSRGRDVTEGGVEKLKIALIVPYDERRLFSLHKVLPVVHDALERHDVTDGLVPGHQFNMTDRLVPAYSDVADRAGTWSPV